VSDFLAALGLVFAIEGLVLAAFPAASRRAMEEMSASPDRFLRRAGLISAGLGVLLVMAAREWGF
jgi:uncharacterized protein